KAVEGIAEEVAQLAPREARAAKVHEAALAWGEARKVPPPTFDVAPNGPFFDPVKWKITYLEPALAAKDAANAVWDVLRGTGVHEMRHAQQWIDMARVALGRGMSE